MHGSYTISMAELSDYYYSLQDAEIKKLYKQKITLFDGQDPYTLSRNNLLDQKEQFPDFR